MNLMNASKEWTTRPADERFTTLSGLKESVSVRKHISYEGNINTNELKVIPKDDDIVVNYDGQNLNMTNWSFGQLSSLAGAPASYLRKLPADLVSTNLNYLLPKNRTGVKVLLSVNGKVETRAFTSETYGRIWDIDVVNAMEKIVEKNPSWRNPPAKTTNGNVNAGLYASDRDIFLFMVDEDHRIEVKGESLSRGFFVWNSEVGKSSFGLMTFLYRYICGNHIVWGASQVKEVRVRHSQNAPLKAFSQVLPQLNNYIESSAAQETETIKKAIEYHPAKNKIDMVRWLGAKGFKKAVAEKAYDKAIEEEGNGTSLWNIIQGITAIARNKAHIDTRVELERKAGSMLQMVS